MNGLDQFAFLIPVQFRLIQTAICRATTTTMKSICKRQRVHRVRIQDLEEHLIYVSEILLEVMMMNSVMQIVELDSFVTLMDMEY